LQPLAHSLKQTVAAHHHWLQHLGVHLHLLLLLMLVWVPLWLAAV
jgi:hypothetical protein